MRYESGRATARVAPTKGYKECGKTGRRGRRPLRKWLKGRTHRLGNDTLYEMRYESGRATARVAPTKFLPIEIRRAGPACPAGSAVRCRRADRGVRPLRMHYWWCVGEGLCPSRGRGRTPPLRKRYKGCSGERNPPVTASPCQPPLGKGAMGTGVRIATTSLRTGLAMTHYKERGAWSAAG